MKTFLLMSGLFCLATLPALAADSVRKPNVLFIAIDDLNDWIGCMKGHPQALTPNMDRLAEQGILFSNAHCAAPVCLASRTAVFSGRRPEKTGVYSNWGETQGKPPASDLQLPLHFSAAGYKTLGAGKLYHANATRYFDEYFTTEQRWSPFTQEQARYTPEELPSKGTDRPRHVLKNGPGHRDWVLPLHGLVSERHLDVPEGDSFDWGPADVADEEMGDARITTWVMERLQTGGAQPWFMGVGYYRPHIPLFAPKQDFDRLPPVEKIELPAVIEDDLSDLGKQAKSIALEALTAGTHAHVVKHDQWRQAVRAYLACITFVDRQIGRLIKQLEESGTADNTWIILWSDHGWQLGEKQHWGKWTGWRQSTRVPLIMVPPRSQSATRGRVCMEPASLLDLYPTLIELCGLPPKDGLSGVSLVPWLNKPDFTEDRAVVTTFDPDNLALSTRDWRYIRYSGGDEELYDLSNDPHEWRNLAREETRHGKLEEMRARLDLEMQPAARVRGTNSK
ncbi:sulfatase [Prosthecobacter sp.]|uniref:sulfatase n=1 Tax=Prosthecobacter sp. TaxID=1965333 RepID=UPI003784C499